MSWFTDLFADLFKSSHPEIEKKSYNKPDQAVFAEPKVVVHDDEELKVASNGIHPIVATKAMAIITEARKAGIKVDLFEGFRSFERQDYLFYKAKTTKAKGGQSWHNYGIAVDIVFKDNKNNFTWNNGNNWKLLGEIGKKQGMVWGGDWGWDMAHFEWHPMFTSTKQALALYNAGGQKAVWNAIDQYIKQGK